MGSLDPGGGGDPPYVFLFSMRPWDGGRVSEGVQVGREKGMEERGDRGTEGEAKCGRGAAAARGIESGRVEALRTQGVGGGGGGARVGGNSDDHAL